MKITQTTTIIITFMLLLFTGIQSFAQSRCSNTAGACIIALSDTLSIQSSIQVKKELKVGLSAQSAREILGYPIDILKLWGGKEKWIYENMFVYFENNKVQIILMRRQIK